MMLDVCVVLCFCSLCHCNKMICCVFACAYNMMCFYYYYKFDTNVWLCLGKTSIWGVYVVYVVSIRCRCLTMSDPTVLLLKERAY
jgi:hypothetical protein